MGTAGNRLSGGNDCIISKEFDFVGQTCTEKNMLVLRGRCRNLGSKFSIEGSNLMNDFGGHSCVNYHGGANLGKNLERDNFVN